MAGRVFTRLQKASQVASNAGSAIGGRKLAVTKAVRRARGPGPAASPASRRLAGRSEARRVGEGCVSTVTSRTSPVTSTKNESATESQLQEEQRQYMQLTVN